MESLKGVLNNIPLPSKIKGNLEIYFLIKSSWEKILKEKVNLAVPLYVEEGILYVGVRDHYELQNLRGEYLPILEKIKGLCENKKGFKISGIKFLYIPEKKRGFKEGIRKKESFLREDWDKIFLRINEITDRDLRDNFNNLIKNFKSVLEKK